jgi:hypothetical protein
MSAKQETFMFLSGILVGGILFGMSLYIVGHAHGAHLVNAARDKEHYETCKLVRTFTPKGGPSVECYVCPASMEETCLVPSWKVSQ